MKHHNYFSFYDSDSWGGLNICSIASNEYPIIVNCTGRAFMETPFTTNNIKGREDFYLIFIEQGEMDIDFGDYTHRSIAGDIIIFPPHYHYKYSNNDGNPLSYLWCHFTGSYSETFLKICGFDPLPCIYHTSENSKITLEFHKMFQIFEVGGFLRNQKLSCRLEYLLLNIATSIQSDNNNPTLEKSLNYIHSSYSKDIYIPDLARMEHLSNSRYITLFKERTGFSPTEYIINLRINIACDLLQNTNMSVKEVSISVGYSDAQNFSKLFKKKVNASPQQYRKFSLHIDSNG